MKAVEALLLQALTRAIKAAAWPEERAVRHWQAEIESFLARARRRFAPSMARLLDLADIHHDALRIARRADIDAAPLPVATGWPMTLRELLDEEMTPERLVASLRAC